jgi:hypothetical protein
MGSAASGGIVCVAMLVLSLTPAAASDSDDCRLGDNPETKIAACTRVIQNRNADAKSKAKAYYDRSSAEEDQEDDDKAFADVNEAIRHDPTFAEAFGWRAYFWRFIKKDLDRAPSDKGEESESAWQSLARRKRTGATSDGARAVARMTVNQNVSLKLAA